MRLGPEFAKKIGILCERHERGHENDLSGRDFQKAFLSALLLRFYEKCKPTKAKVVSFPRGKLNDFALRRLYVLCKEDMRICAMDFQFTLSCHVRLVAHAPRRVQGTRQQHGFSSEEALHARGLCPEGPGYTFSPDTLASSHAETWMRGVFRNPDPPGAPCRFSGFSGRAGTFLYFLKWLRSRAHFEDKIS